MPIYEYECPCGNRREHASSWDRRPASLACECGGAAIPIISKNNNAFVKDRPYEFDRKHVVGNNGAMVGRSAEQQHEGYRRYFEGMRKAEAERRRSGRSKNGIRWIGGMPGEMADSIAQQEGDPTAVDQDPEKWLRKTGMYAGE